MVEDARRSRLPRYRQSSGLPQGSNKTYKDDDTEATSGEEQVDPRLDLVDLDVVSRGDNTSLVQATVQLNDDLARAVVIDDLELANVTYETR